jgi:hypothetical protein
MSAYTFTDSGALQEAQHPSTGLCGLAPQSFPAEGVSTELEQCTDEFACHGAVSEVQAADGVLDGRAILHDPKEYAISEASTEVSCSVSCTRRRRANRIAKAKASSTAAIGNCSLIVERPVPTHVSVSKQKKNELIHDFEAGGDAKNSAIASLFGSMLQMSFEPFGCRVVQAALDVASMPEKECFVAEFRNHVGQMIGSPHANFVIQKLIEVLPARTASFVAQELVGFAVEVSKHRFGCRILCRMVEHHSDLHDGMTSASTDDLIDELLLEAHQLIHHSFARHVLELILEHGSERHKKQIAKVVQNNVFRSAKDRSASYVVEKALGCCSFSDTQAIASEISKDPAQLIMLALHECGCHVVEAVLKLHPDCSQRTKTLLLSNMDVLKTSRYGQCVLQEAQRLPKE